MQLLLKIMAHFLSASGLVIIIMMPKNKYEWMQKIDASLKQLPNDDSFGERQIFLFIILLNILIIQSLIVLNTTNRNEKLASITLMIAATSLWLFKLY